MFMQTQCLGRLAGPIKHKKSAPTVFDRNIILENFTPKPYKWYINNRKQTNPSNLGLLWDDQIKTVKPF
jgi:hypothetical protein